jgi:uncharacterized protein YqeY
MTHPELKEAMKMAMKNKEAVKLSVIRGIISAATNELVAKGGKPTDELPEEDVMGLVRRAAKQRKDSIEQFEKGGRPDLAEKEKEELAILETMLPAQMSEEGIEAAARTKAAELNVELSLANKDKANQLMGALMKDLKGKADGTLVKQVVEKLFV